MIIALDYDKTYTADPELWDDFIHNSFLRQHKVVVVTARSPTKDKIEHDIDADIIYCDGVAKRWALYHYHDLEPEIWIDDKPEGILYNSTATKEILAEWRANDRK